MPNGRSERQPVDARANLREAIRMMAIVIGRHRSFSLRGVRLFRVMK